ncbi:hypothetical protein IFM89_031709 [Coptis chinensis]|uniref:Uncharacterized protein n=1 Tax=Coptis chinensis TaxID=261450 RepID=A0A835IHT3_9MAGN|nr:hypothetical protein IFM89_031709 [Coptis chinensis]
MLSPSGCYTLTIDAGFASAAIFVSVYEERMDLLRAVIIGTPSTPYHDGVCSLRSRLSLLRVGKVKAVFECERFFSSKSSTSFCTWRSTLYGHRSLNKGFPSRSSRNISTMATISSSSKEGSKMLITAGSHTQKLVGIWIFGSAAWPRETPYRLAAHLISAFAIYCGLLWTGLSVVRPEPPADSMAWVRGAAKLQRLVVLKALQRLVLLKGCRRLWVKTCKCIP